MAITFAAVGATVEANGGNLTLGTPPDLRLDDLIVAVIAYKGIAVNFTLPANWVSIQAQTSGNDTAGGIANGLMAYYLMTNAAPPSFTFTRTLGGIARGFAAVYRGVDLTTPVEVSSSATAAAASTTVTSPTITTAVTNAMILLAGCAADDGLSSAQTAATAPTSGWTERSDSVTTTGSDTSVSLADALKASTGATGQLSMTNARSARHVGIAAALKPRSDPRVSLLPFRSIAPIGLLR